MTAHLLIAEEASPTLRAHAAEEAIPAHWGDRMPGRDVEAELEARETSGTRDAVAIALLEEWDAVATVLLRECTDCRVRVTLRLMREKARESGVLR